MSPLSLAAVRLPVHLTRLLLVAVLALGLVLASPVGDAHAAAKKKSGQSSRVAKINKATDVALRQLGDPYRYGAAGPNAFDCSGLIYFSFRKAGVTVPRTSGAQSGAAHRIKRSSLKRGDVMFFHRGGRVYHAAIFLGRKAGKVRMLHAPSTGRSVERSTPWTDSWYAATFRR